MERNRGEEPSHYRPHLSRKGFITAPSDGAAAQATEALRKKNFSLRSSGR